MKQNLQKLKEASSRVTGWFRRNPWAIILLIVLLVYWRLPLTYFEQDEWQAFETYINTADQSIFNCIKVQRPLTCFANSLQWKLFGTHAALYALTSLVLTYITSLVFYRFLLRWDIPRFKAILAAGVAPLFVTGSQAITWFGAFSASLPSFLFALLSLNYFIRDVKTPTWKYQLLSWLCAILALYFKEEALWLLPVLFFAWWTYSAKSGIKLTKQKFLRHLGLLIVTIVIFLIMERSRQIRNAAVFTGLVSSTDSSQYLADVVRSFFLIPLSHLSHVLIAPEYIITASNFVTKTIFAVSQFTTGVVLVYFALLLYFSDKKNRPLIFFLIVWALASFSSYAIFGKNPEFLEGRYYYAAQAPMAALLVISLLPNRITKLQSLNTFGSCLLIIVLLLNVGLANMRMSRSVAIAKERKGILNFIREKTGPLPKKAVIYTETSNYGYAGQAAHILPFQNGIGTTLRVLYQGYDQDYRAVSKKQAYLWPLLNQGYDEVDGVGFGYFREYHKLEEAVLKNKLSVESVFAFRYTKDKMTDITDLVRGKLTVSQKERIPIPRNGWTVTSNDPKGVDNRHGIEKVIDNDHKSDWASPHVYGKYVEVDFGQVIDRVGYINITTADGNSYPRIYSFEYSVDGTTWKEDFKDVGKTVDGVEMPITFQPKSMRKFRITIIDETPTMFLWSLSDINAATVKD